MTHIVIHHDAAGAEHHQQFDEIAAAIEHVETLRNTQGVDGRLFELTEVAFELKPYFKVELGDAVAPPAAPVAPPAPPAPVVEPVSETSAPEPEPEPAEVVEHHDDPEMLFETLTEPIEAIATVAPDSSEPVAAEPRRGLFGR